MNEFDDYYMNQAGSGIGGFEGLKYNQLGGSIWGGIFKNTLLPLLKYVGKKAASTGLNVADDYFSGRKMKESIKDQLKSTAKVMASDAKSKLQKGKGRKRRKHQVIKSTNVFRRKRSPIKKKRTATKRKSKQTKTKTTRRKKKSSRNQFPLFQ